MDRKQQEEKVKAYANAAIIVDITPAVNTQVGKVTMLDRDASLVEEINGDWCYLGQLSDLNDEDFGKIFSAVQANAKKMLAYAR